MTGSLQIKNNKYYIVLNTYEQGKRKIKWINTDLPVKGNKFRTRFRAYWNMLDFSTLFGTTSKLGESSDRKEIIPAKPHGVKEKAASGENSENLA